MSFALAKVKSIIVEQFHVHETTVNEETMFSAHLGGDDLDRIDTVLEVERAFRITITDEEMQEFSTIGDLVRLVEAKQPSMQAAE